MNPELDKWADKHALWNERRVIMNAAKNELAKFLLKFAEEQKLTPAEYLSILVDEMQSSVKTLLKMEVFDNG